MCNGRPEDKISKEELMTSLKLKAREGMITG